MLERVAALLLAAAVLRGAPVAAAGPLGVAVSIPPQAWMVERIGGPRVAVEVMIPPGVDEETYEPSPRQLFALARARLYVEVGHPAFTLETRYVLPFVRSHPGIEVAEMAAGITLLDLPAEAGGGGAPAGGRARGAGREGTDPHIWIAPYTVEIAARNLAGALARVDPAGRGQFRAGLAALLADVRAADAELRRALAGKAGLRFIAYHPAWGYVAHQYGLVQIPVELGGKEPGAASLAALAERARRERVRLVLTPAGYTPKGAEMVARSIGARLVTADYMGRDWPAMIHRLAWAFAQAGQAGEGSGGRR